MEIQPVIAALLSADPGLRQALKGGVGPERRISVDLEITVPFREISEGHLEELRQTNPELVFLDLEDDPDLGLKLTEFLLEADPWRRVVGIGPADSPDLLIAAIQAGISEYLPKPVNQETLRAAIERIERKIGRTTDRQPEQAGKLYTIFSPKGGSGSTTLAANLAIQLQRLTGKKILLVDLDLELGEVALLLGVRPRFNFMDLVHNIHRMDVGLTGSLIEHHSSGVDLLAGPEGPRDPEKAEPVVADQIRRILQFLKHRYDYVVADTPKSFTAATLVALEEADQILLITNIDLPSLRNLKRCLPLIERISGKGKEQLHLVVNRYDSKNVITLEDAEKALGMPISWTLSNDYYAVMESINSGKPVILDGRSRVARDLKALGAELAGLRNAGDARRGWWARTIVDPFSEVWRRTLLRKRGMTAGE